MSDPFEFPEFTFKCPKVWAEMQGDERTRFCNVCNRQVHNLSMMTRHERRTLLSAEGESPCVAYFKHLNGTPVDVTSLSKTDPLKHLLTKAAALSLSTLSMLPSCTSTQMPPPEASEKNPAGVSALEMTAGSVVVLDRREMLQRIVQGG